VSDPAPHTVQGPQNVRPQSHRFRKWSSQWTEGNWCEIRYLWCSFKLTVSFLVDSSLPEMCSEEDEKIHPTSLQAK
jgi:hypothetical protein